MNKNVTPTQWIAGALLTALLGVCGYLGSLVISSVRQNADEIHSNDKDIAVHSTRLDVLERVD